MIGNLAVDMFFVLSGFVIYLNYVDRLKPEVMSICDFIVRRLARIYPLHLLMLSIAVVFGVLVYFRDGSAWPEADWYAIPLHVLLMHAWGSDSLLHWNSPAWSISAEFFAYLIFPVFVHLIDWRRRSFLALILLLAVLSTGLHAYYSVIDTPYAMDIARTGLLRCVVQFTIGTVLCAIFLRLPKPHSGLAVALFVGVLGLVGLRAVWDAAPVIPLIWSALILGISVWPYNRFQPLCWRPLVYLGEISYSTYMMHYLVYIIFKLVFVSDIAAISLVAILGYLIIVLLLSMVLYHGVERPAQRWLLRLWKGRVYQLAA